MNTNNNKNNNGRRCRDVKTQKACEQGWEANIGRKIKQTLRAVSKIWAPLDPTPSGYRGVPLY